MKKIGLITFHSSHNYGSVLQAYALSKKLYKLNYNVEIINLRNKEQKDLYKILNKYQTNKKKIFNLIIYNKLKKRYNHYERFINQVLPTTSKEYNNGAELTRESFDYDIYVCGSDQIWNPVCVDFESAYYLDFVDNDKKTIAYAPSLGKVSFDDDTLCMISKLIKNIDFISVREQKGAEVLKGLTDRNVEVVCDPVLLLDAKEWEEIAISPNIKKPYILTYFLDNNYGNKNMIDYFKKITGYDVVILNEYIRDYFKPYKKKFDASPEEFVGLFKNASLIYTNSFHGTVFATIFNKPFYTSVAKESINKVTNNDSRKTDYLEYIGLKDRMVTDMPPDKKEILNINYDLVNLKIQKYKNKSLEYLINALEEDMGK